MDVGVREIILLIGAIFACVFGSAYVLNDQWLGKPALAPCAQHRIRRRTPRLAYPNPQLTRTPPAPARCLFLRIKKAS